MNDTVKDNVSGFILCGTVWHAIMTLVRTMDLSALYHRSKSEYAYAYDQKTLHILLRVKKDELKQVFLRYGDPFDWKRLANGKQAWHHIDLKMSIRYQTDNYDFYFAEIKPDYLRTKYAFILNDGNKSYAYGPQGIHLFQDDQEQDLHAYFNFPYLHKDDLHQTPSWAKKTRWYQIFPDRFYNPNPNDSEFFEKLPVTNQEHRGGTLKGIIQKLDYLNHLGINGLYLTPIFKSPSVHKYDTTDYTQIDPSFGTADDLKELITKTHELNMKIMLDGVFNHAGFFHPFFQDVIKNGEKSIYKDYFYIKKFPVINFPLNDLGKPYNYHGIALNYETFAFQPSMPKWNTSNPEVETYLLNIVKYYIEEFKIDAWRLDVSNELSHDFLRKLKTVARNANPDVFILGENWDQSSPWLLGDQLDSVMNYDLSYALWDYTTNQISTNTFINRILLHQAYTPKNVLNNLYNLLGSHDTIRLMNRLQFNLNKVEIAFLLLYLMPGTPMIYYGDEIALEGNHDPDNRRPMLWRNHEEKHELTRLIKRLNQLRETHFELMTADFKFISKDILLFTKHHHNEHLLCLINLSEEKTIHLSKTLTGEYVDLINQQSFSIHDTIEMKSNSFYLFYKEENDETNH